MHPRLYMQSFQYATYNAVHEKITFETRLAYGRRCYFSLSKNQFLALNDAIILIDEENAYGHYPLGQYTWMHYNAFDASLYRETKDAERIHFIFASFEEYKKYTHKRLLSLVRLKTTTVPTATRTRQKLYNGRGRHKSEIIAANCKRPLSAVLQSANQSPPPKRSRRGERETASRATNDVIMSHDDEEGPIFSKWHYSNTRRRSDSISPLSSISKGLSTPEKLHFFSPSDTIDAMESE